MRQGPSRSEKPLLMLVTSRTTRTRRSPANGTSWVPWSNAKFVRRITRPEAETLVAELLERVKLVNERDELTHRVTEVRVFGSYLGDKPDLGDIDLAIEFSPRRPTH